MSKIPIYSQSSRRHVRAIAVITALIAVGIAAAATVAPAVAQEKKPNILFIMGDDIGWMQPSIYHQGLAVGETPNIDRIGKRARPS